MSSTKIVEIDPPVGKIAGWRLIFRTINGNKETDKTWQYPDTRETVVGELNKAFPAPEKGRGGGFTIEPLARTCSEKAKSDIEVFEVMSHSFGEHSKKYGIAVISLVFVDPDPKYMCGGDEFHLPPREEIGWRSGGDSPGKKYEPTHDQILATAEAMKAASKERLPDGHWAAKAREYLVWEYTFEYDGLAMGHPDATSDDLKRMNGTAEERAAEASAKVEAKSKQDDADRMRVAFDRAPQLKRADIREASLEELFTYKSMLYTRMDNLQLRIDEINQELSTRW